MNTALKVALVIGLPFLLMAYSSFMYPPGSHPLTGTSELWAKCLTVGSCLEMYSADHGGKYPEGESSTEVFQKLIDEGYINDPSFFYVGMAGKVAARSGAKLKPENVCFDFTSGLGPGDSDKVPVAFLTGFRVTYAPGASAKPAGAIFPIYYPRRQATMTFFLGIPLPFHIQDRGDAVLYRDREATTWIEAHGESIPNFVPPDFKANGKTYRQLTPDGVLR